MEDGVLRLWEMDHDLGSLAIVVYIQERIREGDEGNGYGALTEVEGCSETVGFGVSWL